MLYVDTHEKLILLNFSKSHEGSGLQDFEATLFQGLMGKLALLDEIECKNLSAYPSTVDMDEEIREDWLREELKTIGQSKKARYVLTGRLQHQVLQASEDECYLHVSGLVVRLRLFDVQRDMFCFDGVFHARDVDSTRNCLDNLALSMAEYEHLLNWILTSVVNILVPHQAHQLIIKVLKHPFTFSYDALSHMVQAEQEPDIRKRIELYETVIRLDPHLEQAYYCLGELYKHVRDYERSILSYRKALESSHASKNIRAIYATEAGVGCALLKYTQQAIQWWEKALELNPLQLNAYLNMAHTCEEADDNEKAEYYFYEAQKLAPNDIRTCMGLARLYSKQGEWGKAITQYKLQLASFEEDPWCHSDIANCFLNMGEHESAKYHLEKTTMLDPSGEAGEYARMILSGLTTDPVTG